jgi:hypothetical protein
MSSLVPGKYTVISRVCARLSPVIFSMYRRTDPRSLRFSTHTVAAGASDSPDETNETRRGYVAKVGTIVNSSIRVILLFSFVS